MKRSDYYIFGLAATNIYFFVKFVSMVTDSTIGSVVERGDILGYLIFASFLIGIIIVFNNISRLVGFISTDTDSNNNDVDSAITKVGFYTVALLVTYTLLIFFDAYLVFNLYSGY